MINTLGYCVFKDAGIKIDLNNFNVLAYDNDFGGEDNVINITKLPSWDLDEITDLLYKDDVKKFNDILRKAHKIKNYAYNMLKDVKRTLKDSYDFDIDDDMVIELMGLYNINNKLTWYEIIAMIKKRQGAR